MNGGPAFPSGVECEGRDGPTFDQGMSLRDWFAGQALAGLLANDSDVPCKEELAEDAYRYSDAMLKARGDGG